MLSEILVQRRQAQDHALNRERRFNQFERRVDDVSKFPARLKTRDGVVSSSLVFAAKVTPQSRRRLTSSEHAHAHDGDVHRIR